MTFRRSLSPHKRLALFGLHKGVCHICGFPIDPVNDRWEMEHVVALELSRDDEDKNLKPAHYRCHKRKTAVDAGLIAKAKRRELKHKGAWRSAQPMIGSRASGVKHKMRGGWERRV